MPSRGPWIDHFPDNFLWSNATLILKGMAPYGVVSIEEMDRACEKLRPRWNEPDRGKAWFEEWSALGDQIETSGDDALAEGHKITAIKLRIKGRDVPARLVDAGDADVEVHSGDWAIVRVSQKIEDEIRASAQDRIPAKAD